MLWVIFTLIASIFWAVANVTDKHVMDKEIRDPIVSTFFWGVMAFVIMGGISLLMGNIMMPLEGMAYAVAGGVLYGFAVLIFYRVLLSEEISRVIPIILMTPIIVLVLATVFLGEVFTPIRYAGIGLLIIGAVLISIKHTKNYRFSSVLGITLLAMALFASRDFLLKVATTGSSPWAVMFWASVGWVAVSVTLFAFHHPKITKKVRKGAKHILINAVFATTAFIFYTAAISSGFVSLVSALHSVQAFFVFLLALMLSKLRPKLIKEDINRSAIKLKLVAIAIIIMGSFLIL